MTGLTCRFTLGDLEDLDAALIWIRANILTLVTERFPISVVVTLEVTEIVPEDNDVAGMGA